MNQLRIFPALRNSLAVVIAAASLSLPAPAQAAKVRAYTGSIEIPTYPWSAVKHPYFRGTDKVNIYPYAMLDFLSRERTNRVYDTVVLENEYLRITFLPELGGKIHDVLNKTTGEPMFYVNHVIKPGLIGQCGAWTSGGVEWNTGPQGHTVSCMVPVDVRILPAEKDGSVSVAVGETERIYGTKWTVVVTLRPGRAFIEERIRIYNPTQTIRPYYFWNCTASPNTPGFRFIYPMTLGCDHAGEKFFQWPIDNGKDLTRGPNYIDASSIFAWHCDQDFFGSYNDDLGRGVVSCANHHLVPGKKAWTWGQGGFGKMHQMDLTDTDGPYNEVQTGPLLTQAQVGRLDPSEAVEWQEWWYPVHQIGGFTFANRDVAVNASREDGKLRLRMIGTGSWNPVQVYLGAPDGTPTKAAMCELSPRKPVDISLTVPEQVAQPEVELIARSVTLAKFSVPLRLPDRKPPGPKSKPETAAELAQAGWEDFLFARYPEAETKFKQALQKDAALASAHNGLAFLKLFSAPEAAREQAEAALQSDPDSGLAHIALATALQDENESSALDHAWQAALDPATAVAGRALAGKLLLRGQKWTEAAEALSGPGPWTRDPVCQDRRAIALLMLGQKDDATRLARASLEVDPLDTVALAVLWLAGDAKGQQSLAGLASGKAQPVLELAAAFLELKQSKLALRVMDNWYLKQVTPEKQDPLCRYWAAYLDAHGPAVSMPQGVAAGEKVFPHRLQDVAVLREAARNHPGQASLYLGDVLFQLGRAKEGRQMWESAAKSGAEPVVAFRALGMAAKTLDGDLAAARGWLEKAAQADPGDPIVARDLARVLFELADKAGSDAEKRAAVTEARERLKGAFQAGKGRSDFVGLLARALNRMGEFAETARMLDQVRVTVWEGAHEAHDLFEQSHIALGEAQLKAGHAAEALAEFNRALEYPENLATGKLENAREAHIHYLRGNALSALGRSREAAVAWKLAADEPESNDARIREARSKAKAALESLPR